MVVKICGITNLEDAENAFKFGADLVGFIFVKGTPRYAENIQQIISALPPEARAGSGVAGLFKDEEIGLVIEKILNCDLDYVQLHGEESPEYCKEIKVTVEEKRSSPVKIIKTFKVSGEILIKRPHTLQNYDCCDFFLFDTFHPEKAGGTGSRFDLEPLKEKKIEKPFFIAGGLTPSNVTEVIRRMRPYGVDTSSGVEGAVGKKDEKKLKEFIKNAKDA